MKIINVAAVLKPVQRRHRPPAQGAEDAEAQKKSGRRLAVGVSAAGLRPARVGSSLAADVQAGALARQEMNFSGIMMTQCWCSPVICWRKKKINAINLKRTYEKIEEWRIVMNKRKLFTKFNLVLPHAE